MMKYPTWDANKKMSILNESYAESVVVSDIAFRAAFFVFCWLRKRGAALELNKDYAALMLMEILFERGLVNKETLEAAREKLKKKTDSPKAA